MTSWPRLSFLTAYPMRCLEAKSTASKVVKRCRLFSRGFLLPTSLQRFWDEQLLTPTRRILLSGSVVVGACVRSASAVAWLTRAASRTCVGVSSIIFYVCAGALVLRYVK